MKRLLYIAPAAALVCFASIAMAMFPSSGQPYPRSTGPSAPVTAFQYCWPAAQVSAPCASVASAPTTSTAPFGAAANFTVITKITAAAFNTFSGKSNYGLSLLGGPSVSYHVDAIWAGQSAATGTCTTNSGKCAWDFTSPSQITSGGLNAFTVAAGAQMPLDIIAGTLVSGVGYTFAVDISGGGAYPLVVPNTTTANTNPKACVTSNGCTYTCFATPVAGTGTVTGAISTTTLTVSAVTGLSRLHLGSLVTGSGVTANTIITALGTGTGTTGTYTVNNSQTVGSETLTVSQAASLGKGAGTNTTSAAANSAYFTGTNCTGKVAILGTFNAQ